MALPERRCGSLAKTGGSETLTWNTPRDLGADVAADDVLLCIVRGAGGRLGYGGRVLAATTVCGAALQRPGQRAAAALRRGVVSLPGCTLVLERCSLPPDPRRTVLYLVRHGESMWNQAQREKNVRAMMGFDHPLTTTGARQAEGLRGRWREALRQADEVAAAGAGKSVLDAGAMPVADSDVDIVSEFASAGAVFCSPLTRALQTAAIALRGHPALDAEAAVGRRTARSHRNSNGSSEGAPAEGTFVEGGAEALQTALVGSLGASAAAGAGPLFGGDWEGMGGEGASEGGIASDRRGSANPVFTDEGGPVMAQLASGGGGVINDGGRQPADLLGVDTGMQRALETLRVTALTDGTAQREAGGSGPSAGGGREGGGVGNGADGSAQARAAPPLAGRITLLSSSREVKGIGGLDTVGVATGSEIAVRAASELQAVAGVALAKVAFGSLVIDFNDATSQWWTTTDDKDTSRDMEDRLADFLHSVRHSGTEVVISVGHSLFIRQLCRRLIRDRNLGGGAAAERLAAGKINNAGVVRLELDFADADADDMPRLADCQLVFGSVVLFEK